MALLTLTAAIPMSTVSSAASSTSHIEPRRRGHRSVGRGASVPGLGGSESGDRSNTSPLAIVLYIVIGTIALVIALSILRKIYMDHKQRGATSVQNQDLESARPPEVQRRFIRFSRWGCRKGVETVPKGECQELQPVRSAPAHPTLITELQEPQIQATTQEFSIQEPTVPAPQIGKENMQDPDSKTIDLTCSMKAAAAVAFLLLAVQLTPVENLEVDYEKYRRYMRRKKKRAGMGLSLVLGPALYLFPELRGMEDADFRDKNDRDDEAPQEQPCSFTFDGIHDQLHEPNAESDSHVLEITAVATSLEIQNRQSGQLGKISPFYPIRSSQVSSDSSSALSDGIRWPTKRWSQCSTWSGNSFVSRRSDTDIGRDRGKKNDRGNGEKKESEVVDRGGVGGYFTDYEGEEKRDEDERLRLLVLTALLWEKEHSDRVNAAQTGGAAKLDDEYAVYR